MINFNNKLLFVLLACVSTINARHYVEDDEITSSNNDAENDLDIKKQKAKEKKRKAETYSTDDAENDFDTKKQEAKAKMNAKKQKAEEKKRKAKAKMKAKKQEAEDAKQKTKAKMKAKKQEAEAKKKSESKDDNSPSMWDSFTTKAGQGWKNFNK